MLGRMPVSEDSTLAFVGDDVVTSVDVQLEALVTLLTDALADRDA